MQLTNIVPDGSLGCPLKRDEDGIIQLEVYL